VLRLLVTREEEQERKWRAEREGSLKGRGEVEVQSQKTGWVETLAGKKARRRSEMDVEMAVLEEMETGR
jgi:hypothetical protein